MESSDRVTIYDVAKAAGVSPSTVSRAYSRPGRVSSDTAAKVFAAAKELGFHAKPVVRNDGYEPTNIIAFAVADIANPVFTQILNGFRQELSNEDYTVIVIDTLESGDYERKAIERVISLVDGVALSSSRMSDSTIAQVAKQRPVVVTHRTVRGMPAIIPDTEGGIGEVLTLLQKLGHRNVTYISGPQKSWSDGIRWRIIHELAEQRGLVARRLSPNTPDADGGFDAVREWMEHPTSGVIAYNDYMAIGFIKALARRGISVPDDVSVVGIDNSIHAVLNSPKVTSLGTSGFEIGRRAARVLLRDMGNRPEPVPAVQKVPMRLFMRETVAKAKQN